MNRREFCQGLVAGLAVSSLLPTLPVVASEESRHLTDADQQLHGSVPKGPPQQIAMLTYPFHAAQDLVGPYTFLAALGNVKVHLL